MDLLHRGSHKSFSKRVRVRQAEEKSCLTWGWEQETFHSSTHSSVGTEGSNRKALKEGLRAQRCSFMKKECACAGECRLRSAWEWFSSRVSVCSSGIVLSRGGVCRVTNIYPVEDWGLSGCGTEPCCLVIYSQFSREQVGAPNTSWEGVSITFSLWLEQLRGKILCFGCVWTRGPYTSLCLERAVEPLGDETSLEEVGH